SNGNGVTPRLHPSTGRHVAFLTELDVHAKPAPIGLDSHEPRHCHSSCAAAPCWSRRIAMNQRTHTTSSSRSGVEGVNGVRRGLLCQVSTALGLTLIIDATAVGHPQQLRVNIGAGNAAVTLAEFIHQTGLQVLFETDSIRGHATRAVRGQLDAAEA